MCGVGAGSHGDDAWSLGLTIHICFSCKTARVAVSLCLMVLEFATSCWNLLPEEDDAHIFCRESQIKDQVKGVLEFMSCVYEIFGFTFNLTLSTTEDLNQLNRLQLHEVSHMETH
ncbi:hypothetical protein SASPL_151654 [Salvia splendens]|uniref:Uncharacterized protein n=1 Tax=Salvia splendens TaxID=180675 RepID=A0A8X8W8B9_SALSN|nr:hypothetical protein SASPL_151654 [Salvia splendens]